MEQDEQYIFKFNLGVHHIMVWSSIGSVDNPTIVEEIVKAADQTHQNSEKITQALLNIPGIFRVLIKPKESNGSPI